MNPFAYSIKVLRKDGLLVFYRKNINRVRSGSSSPKAVYIEDSVKSRRWDTLKDAYKGQRAFLIGNGPSLNRTPLHLLQDEFTLCFNRFNLMFERLTWRPTMYMCVDERVAEDMASESKQLVRMSRYAFFPDVHPSGVDFRAFIEDAENVFWLSLDWGGFYQDLPHVGLGGTVANVGLQVLCFMGFSPIYLVGVDMDYKDHKTAIKHDQRNWTSTIDDDPNHFDPRYFGKGRKYHYPRLVENMLPSMQKAKDITDRLGIKVFNAGVGGALEVFPRVDFRNLFNESYEQELQMFLRAIGPEWHGSSLEDAFPAAKIIENSTDWSPDLPFSISRSELAEKLIPKAIFTHIPYGPISDRYLFVKRTTNIENQ